MIEPRGENRVQHEIETRRVTNRESGPGPKVSQPLSVAKAPDSTAAVGAAASGNTPSLPNWESVLETYLAAAELFGRDSFDTRDMADARLGTSASSPALDAEATSLYNLLRAAAMYGLVEWYGLDEFAVRVLPEADTDTWENAFYMRAKLLRDKVESSATERKRLRAHREKTVDTVEYKSGAYLTAYVGVTTEAENINAFVYNAWDPKNHVGVVLRARGKNIPFARDVAERLRQGASDVFEYSRAGEDVYRDDHGLCADIFLEIKLRG